MSVTMDQAWAVAEWIGRPVDQTREVDPTSADDERSEIARSLWPVTYLRHEVTLPATPSSADVRVSALGLYRLFINGIRVGDEALAPGWTDYSVRVHRQEFEVASLLRGGRNAIALEVADGWFSGYVGFDRGHQARLWGDVPRARLAIVADGDVLCVTDADWRRGDGTIRSADLQMGETHAPAFEPVGWRDPGFDDQHWATSAVGAEVDPIVTTSPGPPMRVVETLPARDVVWRSDRRCLVDFGQNVTGVVRVRLRGVPAGTQVHLRHAEVLDADGEPYRENLRSAEAHDVFVSDGHDYVFEPRYTFHWFRYVEIDGVARGAVALQDVQALVIHSSVARVGTFTSSDPRLDRLHENMVWSVRGNLLDVPTDCPQRDERLGWLGDAGLIMPSALFALELDGFLEKWLVDVRDAQRPRGAYSDVAPLANLRVEGAPGWADAGVWIPWHAFLATGSVGHLEQNYSAMERFMAYLMEGNPSLVRRHRLNRNYGDWLNLDDATPKDLLATAYWAYDAEILAHTAIALGRTADADRWTRLRDGLRRSFADEYLEDDDRLTGDSQTSYAMALHLDLVPRERRAGVAERFVEKVAATGHLTTGIHGTRFLAPALSDIGRSDLAYRMLLADGYPSWLHAVGAGATTIWERWDGWTSERGFQDPRMNSFNHYALGSIAEWLHTYVAGIGPDPRGPGYAMARVRPYPAAGDEPALRHVSARRTIPEGELATAWELTDRRLRLHVEVPPRSKAEVWVPTTAPETVAGPSSAHPLGHDGGWSGFAVGAGTHDFEATLASDWRGTARVADARRLTH